MLVEKWDLLSSLYFLIVTLTSVGYGATEPATAIGKIVTVGAILLGIVVVGTLVADSVESVLHSHQNLVRDHLRDTKTKEQLDRDKIVDLLENKNRSQLRNGLLRIAGLGGGLYLSAIVWCKGWVGMSLVDALYFTTVTVSTVGYGSVGSSRVSL